MFADSIGRWAGALSLIIFLCGEQALRAKTIEVEVGGVDSSSVTAASSPLTLAPPENLAPPSTPTAGTPATSSETVIQTQDLSSPENLSVGSSKNRRIRAPQNLSFYNFLSAGFVVSDSDPVEPLGKVFASSDDPESFTPPEKDHVALDNPAKSKVGDLWTIYRLKGGCLDDPDLSFQGSLADVLAVVQVEEIVKNYARVKIIQGFSSFTAGDLVRDYAQDVKRWKRAQTKKNLPLAEIRCMVAGGPVIKILYQQMDMIVLTAGTRRGVVEGMTFELDEQAERVTEGAPLLRQIGSAEVFYSGNTYCLACVTQSHDGIQKGFTAIYRP